MYTPRCCGRKTLGVEINVELCSCIIICVDIHIRINDRLRAATTKTSAVFFLQWNETCVRGGVSAIASHMSIVPRAVGGVESVFMVFFFFCTFCCTYLEGLEKNAQWGGSCLRQGPSISFAVVYIPVSVWFVSRISVLPVFVPIYHLLLYLCRLCCVNQDNLWCAYLYNLFCCYICCCWWYINT